MSSHHQTMPAAKNSHLVQKILAFRIIPDIDKNPRIIAFTKTWLGRIVLTVVFALLLMMALHPDKMFTLQDMMPFVTTDVIWQALMVGVMLCTFLRSHYSLALVLSVVAGWLIIPLWVHLNLINLVIDREGLRKDYHFYASLRYPVFLLCLALMAGLVWAKSYFKNSFFAHRPFFCVLMFYLGAIGLAASHLLHGAPQLLLWTFISMFGPYLWFLGYALGTGDMQTHKSILFRCGIFFPFWGFANHTVVPFTKDVHYLEKIGSDTPDDFAVTQLKACKLILWCIILELANIHILNGIRGYLHVPQLKEALAGQAAGRPYAWYLCWGSLFHHFLIVVLGHATIGNITVASGRMAGFRLLRNTYKPFSSNSVAEFWRRISFYFYQLMMTFFFYPTYLRCFKKHKRLRLFFATFMAACVGNILLHFMGTIYFIADSGVVPTILRLQNYIVYSILLAIGIAVSQLKTPSPIYKNGFWSIAARRLRVLLFVCVILLFDTLEGTYGLSQRFSFFLHLLGIV